MTTVCKLGGSVITRKNEPETVDREALRRAADAIGGAIPTDGSDPNLVLVHGGGSFGHHAADQHDVTVTQGTTDARAAREIHDAMLRLNGTVIDALQDAAVPALGVHPLSAARRDRDGDLTYAHSPVSGLLSEGFVPVLHGDGVVSAGAGVTVLSGDELVVALARALDADRVGLCAGVPGVLDDDGEVIRRIDRYSDVAEVMGTTAGTDVTGGMGGKVRTLLELELPASIFGLGGLSAFLDGEKPGTLIDGT